MSFLRSCTPVFVIVTFYHSDIYSIYTIILCVLHAKVQIVFIYIRNRYTEVYEAIL